MAAALCCWMSAFAFTIPVCPGDQEKAAADYYLSNPYYAYCADYSACKLSGDNDGTVDFNWDQSVVFGGINLTKAGAYKMVLNFKCGQNNAAVKLLVNGAEDRVVDIPNSSWAPSSITIEGINLVAGENTIAFQQKAEWPLLHNFELTFTPVEQEPDYYLSNPYLTSNSEYWDEVYEGDPATTKKNSIGWIKIYDDGWSDYHWDGPSAVVYNNINMSKAGKYNVTMETRNKGKIDFVVNGVVVETMTMDGTSPVVKQNVELAAGMNTIALQKNSDWVAFKQITIAKAFDPAVCEIGADVTCPETTSATEADFYLDNFYYFLCTKLTATGNPDYPYTNAEGENIKVSGNFSDYHWDGPSSVIYDNINLSTSGVYTLYMYGRNGGKFSVVINNDTVDVMSYSEGKAVATINLKKGANTIKLAKHTDWPGHYAIGLKFISAAELKTVITLDANGGTAGAVTSVEAKMGEAMPALNATQGWAPTAAGDGWFFDGYWDAAEGGAQYYTVAGESARNWDKEDETFTLYAHWVEEKLEPQIDVECPDKVAAAEADFYLENNYYALCSNFFPVVKIDEATGKKYIWVDGDCEVMYNADSAYFKICTDHKYVDWHWNDWKACDSCPVHKSALVYDEIYVSQDGNYDILYFQRNGGKVDVFVNGELFAAAYQLSGDTSIIYRAPLKAGQANVIKVQKNDGWPQSYGLKLQKSSELIIETTVTLDMQGGTGGTEEVVARKGYDMPEITIPVRDGYHFEGYYTEIEGGEQYYAQDGSSFQVWNKEDETFTLYAHWNNGSIGDCPCKEDKIKEDYYLTHMYDGRCTNLTNTWEKDNGEYIYLTTDGDKIKITENGEWLDFYWADPSAVIFDSIYVSKDEYYDMTWYFRCDVIDGAAEDGSTSHIYVNDELYSDITVYITDEGVELDQTTLSGLELYADWPNKIKILKGNGWVLTKGIQLSREGTDLKNVKQSVNLIKMFQNGMISIIRNGKTYNVYGTVVR